MLEKSPPKNGRFFEWVYPVNMKRATRTRQAVLKRTGKFRLIFRTDGFEASDMKESFCFSGHYVRLPGAKSIMLGRMYER